MSDIKSSTHLESYNDTKWYQKDWEEIREKIKEKNLKIDYKTWQALRDRDYDEQDPDPNLSTKLLFEKYAIPGLYLMGPKELKNFYKCEQDEIKTEEECNRIIYRFIPRSEKIPPFLTLSRFNDFLIENQGVFNPIHLEQCQNIDKSLVHYYVATAKIIRCPNETEERQKLIKDLKTNEIEPKLSEIEQFVLAKYRDLLYTFRCFQFKVIWDEKEQRIGVTIIYESKETIGIGLELLLKNFCQFGFRSKYPYDFRGMAFNPYNNPIILDIDCSDLVQKGKMNTLIQNLQSNLKGYLIKGNQNGQSNGCFRGWLESSNSKLPTLKSLFHKFVIIFKNHSIDPKYECTLNPIVWNESQLSSMTTNLEKDYWFNTKFTKIEKKLDEIEPLQCSLSISKSKLPELIKEYAEKTMNHRWPSITLKSITTIHDDDNNTGNEILATSLIGVGIQSISINDLNLNETFTHRINLLISRALFQLNGKVGYVLNSAALRKGKSYCIGFTEDKPLKNEPFAGPTRFMFRIDSVQDFPIKFSKENPMCTKVMIDIFGHKDDYFHFETKECTTDGQKPTWNEETRPVIRLPNFAFIYFRVLNNDQLIGHRIFPIKCLLKGYRSVILCDPEDFEQRIDEERLYEIEKKPKLFVRIGYKKIADSWSPEKRAESYEEDSDEEEQEEIKE